MEFLARMQPMPSETTPFSYIVEVSGWDSMHNFFVEKAPLQLLPGESAASGFRPLSIPAR